eukprot:TRINITY_DN7141_c0_g1_i2.p1 TRINITY_DN7141_c0_g1~~TRINITY_DN7141_c0_g1_i2.p1  ORF type:complete len:129 (+),score=26.36 TRINITY_DN7141_c0_g1_i2:140-526(+)
MVSRGSEKAVTQLRGAALVFSLYRTCTRLGFGLWALRCVRDALRERERKRTQEGEPASSSMLRWSSESGERLIKWLSVSLPLDLVLMQWADGVIPTDFWLHHGFSLCLSAAFAYTRQGLFYGLSLIHI